MNYEHLYHAGNFADVVKHSVLITLSKFLSKKEGALCYLDTHAGSGYYDLTTTAAQKTGEYQNGIAKIYYHSSPLPLINHYQKIVRAVNGPGVLRYYPGSPAIIQTLLRPQDQLIATELKLTTVQALKRNLPRQPQLGIHHLNGYQGLKAFLPPPTRRGLILIDPPFEAKNEITQLYSYLHLALNRFTSGVYMLWYPLKTAKEHHLLRSKLLQLMRKNLLIIKFSLKNGTATGLTSCGIAILNAPWKIEVALEPLLTWLATNLAATCSSELITHK